jgi:Tol biopolymer transport system component
VFGSNHDPAKPALAIYAPKTGKTREVHVNLAGLSRPQWYAHGSAIMVLGAAKDGRVGQFRINPDNGEATLFRTAKDLESGWEGVWTPDGKTHFNRYTDWKRGIFRLDADTGQRQTIYVPPAGVDITSENLALSPDGRTLAFHARNAAEGTATLMLVPAKGGEARPLLTIRRPESFLYGAFTWTPDSRGLLVARTRNNRTSEIWQVPVDGGAPSKIDFPAMRITSLRLNPDGKTIAFFCWKWRSEIWVLENFLKP